MARPSQPRAKKILSSLLTVSSLLIILILISWAIYNNLSKQKTVNLQSQKLEQEIWALEKQNLELASLIDYFASNEYIEQEAREKLNLAQPDEKVIIIPDESKNGGVINQLDKNSLKSKIDNPISRWWNYFFGN